MESCPDFSDACESGSSRLRAITYSNTSNRDVILLVKIANIKW